ncbi:MAG: tRNA lysidine(34) synthetase TilS [Bacilli bacterium]|nr:tRNA lysidine(34) synthetase TilS [Bacilli bacterium]
MFTDKVLSHNLIKKGDSIVIGVSGGADSMALLAILLSLREKWQLKLFVAHVNHHTRGYENEQEAQLIAAYCNRYQIPFYIGHFHKSGSENFHDEARKFRYEFFVKVAKTCGANKIALAHHEDDQVETVLFKIMRGNQLGGYVGMKSTYEIEQGIHVIRPLLSLTKQALITYCETNDIPYLVDSSNLSDKYARNFLRNRIIPLFKELQPDFNTKIIQLHEQLSEVDAFLQKNAQILSKELIILTEQERIILDCNKLKTIPLTVLRVILLNVIKKLNEVDLELTYEKTNTLINIINSTKPNLYYDLGKNIYCVKAYDKISFQKGLPKVEEYAIIIDELKEYMLPNGMKIRLKKVEEIAKTNNKKLFLCYNSTIWPLMIRTRLTGDYINTQVGRKKVNRVFIDEKIPAQERKTWPLLVDRNDNVLWVIGLQKCDYRAFPKCGEYIEIEIIS